MLFYQNDDFGKDFVNGLREVPGDRYSSIVQDRRFAAVTLPRPTSDRRQLRRGHRRHATRTARLSKATCCCNNRYVRADHDLVCIDGGDAG